MISNLIKTVLILSLYCFYLEGNENTISKKGTYDFGGVREFYTAGRKAYPNEAFEHLKTYAQEDANVLDLGAGTGISTRQLYDHGFKHLIGCDKDSLMIKEAILAGGKQYSIPYIQGNIESGLTFPTETFDLITAFTCFHYFQTDVAMEEIKRILKPNGLLFTILKESKKDKPTFRDQVKQIADKVMGKPIPKVNDGLESPIVLLKKHHFEILENISIPFTEYYTVEEAILETQSRGWWTTIKDDPKKDQILSEIIKFLQSIANDQGLITYEGVAPMIIARKQEP